MHVWEGLRAGYARRECINLESLRLEEGRWNCIVGLSGSGKSTLLKALAGLIDSSAERAPSLTTAMLFQEDSLVPWLDVEANLLLGPRLRGERISSELRERALACLHQVGLGDYRQALPRSLSGGMRARVALARTLLEDAQLLLLDEPFSALDASTRSKIHRQSFRLLSGRSVLLVTHDPLEALSLGHSLQLLHPGGGRLSPLPTPAGEPIRSLAHADLGACYEQILAALQT